jgi:hypothetical protein
MHGVGGQAPSNEGRPERTTGASEETPARDIDDIFFLFFSFFFKVQHTSPDTHTRQRLARAPETMTGRQRPDLAGISLAGFGRLWARSGRPGRGGGRPELAEMRPRPGGQREVDRNKHELRVREREKKPRLWYHVRNKQLVFQRGQRPQYIVHVHV